MLNKSEISLLQVGINTVKYLLQKDSYATEL